ncbi:MAG: bifunctional riboflavin kinase/FAD synthetase [Eubacteriales bacterium]
MESIFLKKSTTFPCATTIALGFFDGIHLGHRQLIKEMKKIALEKKLVSCVVTFDNHPLNLVFPKYAPKLISSIEEKVKILQKLNIDKFVLLNFTEKLMNYDPEAFVRDILVKQMKVKYIVVGFNYNFGYKGTGTAQLLKQLGLKYDFEVLVVHPYEVENQVISSTFIRNLISSGKVDLVKKYLGRKFSITGVVIKGKGLGRTFSIPTANIHIDENRITPEPGVYFTYVYHKEKKYVGLTNVGFNPTFSNHPFSIETYIYDFDEDIYNEKITVEFQKRIRKEKKFKTVDELMHQIKNDISLIRKKYMIIKDN